MQAKIYQVARFLGMTTASFMGCAFLLAIGAVSLYAIHGYIVGYQSFLLKTAGISFLSLTALSCILGMHGLVKEYCKFLRTLGGSS